MCGTSCDILKWLAEVLYWVTTKVIGRLNRPLISAEGDEREGYVPNVVYSCGGMMNGDLFYIPYAMSDSMAGFAWLDMNELLAELEEKK